MKLVLDTNIILKALIRNSTVRAILVSPRHQFYLPEHAIDETRKHLDTVQVKTGLSEEEVETVLNIVVSGIEVIRLKDLSDKWEEATKIMKPIDIEDIPFVAAALSMSCDGIWSDDRHLKRQTKVKVWTTRDMLQLD